MHTLLKLVEIFKDEHIVSIETWCLLISMDNAEAYKLADHVKTWNMCELSEEEVKDIITACNDGSFRSAFRQVG